MSRIVGNVIVEGYTVLDGNSDPLTGVTSPAGVTLTLQRQSGSTMLAASETVTWTEIAATGRYYFAFTPANSGAYILYLRELHASSMGQIKEFRYDVVSAGATFSATYANAYCAESDIERWLQQAISATTAPNDSEAGAFAESRASVLSSLCAAWGYSVTPSTVTAGSRLEDLLREANAIGAALDYTVAQQVGQRPSLSERAERLQVLWIDYVGDEKHRGFLEREVRGNLASLATDHILSGDTAARAATAAPTETAIGFTMGDLF